jgi:Ca2+:H+ antiporter
MLDKLGVVAREEWMLGFSAATSLVLLLAAPAVAAATTGLPGLALLFLWLFATVIGSGLAVVRHADHVAIRLGEPYGTLILTLAVTAIELMSISAMTMQGAAPADAGSPALVRDTLFAVVMIILNGMVGISLLLGGWRHREQTYNLQGANAYLGVIIPLTVLSLILPNYTLTTPGPTLSAPQEIFLVVISVSLYAAFLAVQTSRHRAYFTLHDPSEAGDHAPPPGTAHPLAAHIVLLAAYMLPVVFLAEQLAEPLHGLLHRLEAPGALGGIVVALLVATPEAVGAVRAAIADQLQRSMNIFLGSVLSTIGLTIPAILVLGQLTGQKIILGLENADAVMLLLTLAVSLVTFTGARTHVLQGAVHLVLFAAYILLIFQG